jgi:hypothetical protein
MHIHVSAYRYMRQLEKDFKKMFIVNDDDFLEFCRKEFESVNRVLDLLGLINDDNFEGYLARNYSRLENIYINEIDKTIH